MKKSSVIKGSLTGGLQSIFQILVLFIAIPVFIKILGIESYGIFCLISSVGNLQTFTNLGLSSSIVKHLSEQGKCQESDHDIIISMTLLLTLLSITGFVFIFFHKYIIISIMSIPHDYYSSARWLLFFTIWSNFFLVVGQIFKAVIDACGKVHITNYLQIMYTSLYWILIILTLLIEKKLAWVGGAIFAVSIIWFFSIVYYALKLWGIPKLKNIQTHWIAITAKHLNYGGKIFISGLINFFYEPLLRLIIANFIGIKEVAFFDVALKIKDQLWGFIIKIYYPIFPYFAQKLNNEKIENIILELQQKTLYIMIPLTIGFNFAITPFIDFWIGENISIIARTAQVIVSSFLVTSIATPFYFYLIAKNHPEKTIVIQGTTVIASILTFFTAYSFELGYYSAIFATAAGIISAFIVSQLYQKSILGCSLISSSVNIIHILLLTVSNCIVGFLLIRYFGNEHILIFISPLSIMLLSLFLFRYLNLFSTEEIERYIGKNMISNIFLKLLCKN